ncbi:MAG: deoxynucleoside kinase [Patescibacteria group bacterium]|nr:deoxynucleoside kinase [Patescibacteria group bacterium]
MEKHIFVSVMGTMGAGKTTIANILAEELKYALLLEQFDDNPFLPKFYKTMNRWAFPSQTFFLLEKCRQMKQIPSMLKEHSVIQDTPMLQDVYSYAKAQYKLGNMDRHEWNLYLKTYESLSENLIKPDVIICLNASIDTLMDRIAKRGRSYEQTIPRSYIELLDSLNKEWIQTTTIPVIHIDTDTRDIVNKSLDKEYILITLRHALAQYTR